MSFKMPPLPDREDCIAWWLQSERPEKSDQVVCAIKIAIQEDRRAVLEAVAAWLESESPMYALFAGRELRAAAKEQQT